MTEAPEVVKFIDQTLADMTTRPAFWGPLPGVELQVLRLLEIRLLLVESRANAGNATEVARSYWDALARDFPGSEAVSLRTRVNDDVDAFSRWLTKFCAEQQRAQDQRADRPRIFSLRPGPPSSVPRLRPYTAAPPASDQPVSPGESRLPR
jgi:hypothetical protein